MINDFFFDFVDVGSGKVNFVYYGDDVEVLLKGEVNVGEGLGLDALSSIDDENGGFHGLETAGDFVAKIHMAGGVDEVKFVAFVMHLDGREFDGNTLFSF